MKKRIFYYGAVLIVIFLALSLRLYAAQRLNVDYDEEEYLGDSLAYAKFMREGQWKMFVWYETTYEHPPLDKILFGVALLTQPPLDKISTGDLIRLAPIKATEAGQWDMAARYLSVLWGTLAVGVLAIINPLAGFFLGVGTLSVKYTSEVYLEAFPLLTSLVSAATYMRWFANIRKDPTLLNRNTPWLALSALFLGLTAASKYVYCIVGIAIAVHFLIAFLQKQFPPRVFAWFVGWGVFSVLMFFAFDPYLWPHPLSRLIKTIAFHARFQDSYIVNKYNYPFWQPLVWLSVPSQFYNLRPKSAFIFNIDILICIFAVIGLPRFFQHKRIYFYWLMVGLSFLLIWTTKWPQYTLVIFAPFSIAASEGVITIWNLISKYVISKFNKPEPKGV